jgi:GNAT superfamily N-acetyltransferase
MIIRDGRDEDLDLFFELWWLNTKEHEEYNELDRLKLRKHELKMDVISSQRECMRDADHIFLVAEEQWSLGLTKILGMASGHIGDRDEPGFELDREGYIDDIFVLEGSRMKGTGKKMLDELIRRLYGKGANFIGLAVAAQNPAVNFYKKNGFEVKSFWMTRADKAISGDGTPYPQTKKTKKKKK